MLSFILHVFLEIPDFPDSRDVARLVFAARPRSVSTRREIFFPFPSIILAHFMPDARELTSVRRFVKTRVASDR